MADVDGMKKADRMQQIWEETQAAFANGARCVDDLERCVYFNEDATGDQPQSCAVGRYLENPREVQSMFGDTGFGDVGNEVFGRLDDRFLVHSAKLLPQAFWNRLQAWHDSEDMRPEAAQMVDELIDEYA